MSNNIKNWLGVAGVVAVLALAFGIISFVSTFRYLSPATNTIGVEGEGKVVAIPDIATFSYSVINEGGKDIAKLQKDNTDKGNAIIKLLKTNGVEDKDIKTTSYNITPRYTTYNCWSWKDAAKPCPPSEITGYTVSQSAAIKVRDFKKISGLLGGAASLGANNVSGLSFTVEDPDALKTVARGEAIQKARAKAEAMAKAGGFSLGRLISINEGGGRSYYDYAPMMSKAMETGAGGAALPSPSVEPGSQEVIVSVALRYEIK